MAFPFGVSPLFDSKYKVSDVALNAKKSVEGTMLFSVVFDSSPFSVSNIASIRFVRAWQILSLGILFFFGFSVSSQLLAEGVSSTDLELDKFAQKVIDFLEQEEEAHVVVGRIQPVGNRSIPGAPGLSARLVSSLNRLRPGVVSDNAFWTIEGKLFAGEDPKDLARPESERNFNFVIKFSVVDQRTQKEWNESVVINKLSDVQIIVGANSETGVDADVREIRAELRRSLTSSPVIDPLVSSKVRPKFDSPYALELRSRPLGAESKPAVPVTVVLEKRAGILPATEQSLAFAPVGINAEYEIAVYNESDNEIAVAIFVDGMDVFTFSEDLDPQTKKSRFTHFIVAKQEKLLLPGWHKTVGDRRDDNFFAFLVTEYGKGARSQVFPIKAADQDVGAVTVAISQSFPPGSSQARSNAETGKGRPIKQSQSPQIRLINPPHAFITLRYDR
jgi:hypothetical protein